MRKTKKALACMAIAGMTLSMIPFNVFASSTVPTRIAGITAEQTAVAIADQTGYTGTAILASSTSYGMVDALTAGPLATSLKAPILLTGAGNTLDAATKAELTKLAVKKVYVTSGTAVIKQGVIDELKGMGIEVVTLGGFDRAETSVNIAKHMTGVSKVAVANTVVDALSIAAVASAANEPILLTDRDALPASVASYLASAGATASDVIGGTGVISNAVVAGLPSSTRHAGMTAYDTNNQVIQDFAGALKFDNIYVANGVTGIDALAGAPLAAQTKSPIVLTDGKTVPQAAAFTHGKNANAAVTALGGEVVVPESVRTGVAAGQVTTVPGDLAIVSVSALDDTNTYLQIDFSKAVGSLASSDINFKDAKTGATYGVKTVTLAANGMSAQVELFSNPNANSTDKTLQFLTDYIVTVNANGTKLTFTFNRPLSMEARVTKINPTDKEITVIGNKNNYQRTLKVLDPNFDYQGAIGTLIQVWYNNDSELIKSLVNTDNTKYDAIEITKTNEIKLLSTDTKYDVSTDTYTAGGSDYKFKFFLNGVLENGSSNALPSSDVDKKFNYAKIGFDKSGKIEYVSAYDLAQFVIVDKVDGNEVVGVEGTPTGGSFDAEDATIVKDGKLIGLDGIKKGDVLFYHIDSTKKLRFAEVYSNTVTGAIDTVYDASVEVNGKTYDYVYDSEIGDFNLSYATAAVYIDSDGKVKKIDSDAAETLQAGGDVTLYFDRAGHLVYIAGATADVESNSQAAILTDSAQYDSTFGKDKLQLSAVLANGDEKVYDLTLKDLDKITIDGTDYKIDSSPGTDTAKWAPTITHTGTGTAIDPYVYSLKLTAGGAGGSVSKLLTAIATEGMLTKIHLTDSGSVKQVEFFTTSGSAQGYVDTGVGTTVKSGDSYVGGKRLLSSTVVFDANKGYDNSAPYAPGDIKAGDVTVTKWGDYKGTDIVRAGYIYNDDNEVIALAIDATSSTDTSFQEAVATNILRNSDHDVVGITAYVNGVEKTYTVDTVSAPTSFVKGDTAILEIDDNNPDLVTNIRLAGDAQFDNRVDTGLVVSSVDVGARKVTFTNGKTYTLADNGAVLDGTNNSDITVENLADLRGKNNVTVVLDTQVPGLTTGAFAKYFEWETNLTPVTPPAPAVTNNDTTNTVTGMAAGMEYNLDGAGYVAYNATAFSALNFSGNHTLLVRVAAAGVNPAGSATTLTFTTNPVVFAPTTNNSTANDVPTLNVVGNSAVSGTPAVATATIAAGKIAITSVSAGTATITVTDGVVTTPATITVTVAADGTITIGTVVKAVI